LLCDIVESSSVATTSGAVTTEAPQWRHASGARFQTGPIGPHQNVSTDALFAAKVQSLLQLISQAGLHASAVKAHTV
jgi:hypothetical protein